MCSGLCLCVPDVGVHVWLATASARDAFPCPSLPENRVDSCPSQRLLRFLVSALFVLCCCDLQKKKKRGWIGVCVCVGCAGGRREERGMIHRRISDCFPSSPVLLPLRSVQVPCAIGRLGALWQWHRPGFGQKLSPPLTLRGSSGQISEDLSAPAGWHRARSRSERSVHREIAESTRIRSEIIIQSQHK